ncbi:MAG: IclR family transcriptional regulator [Caulobacteraceae bacterium]
MKQQTASSVKSAARAIDTVEHVALHGPVNARGISRATGIPESSLSYLLATLVDRGWLVQEPDRTYRAGPALARLSGRSPATLLQRAQASMRTLTAVTGETSCLFIRQGDEIEVLQVEHSSHELRFTPQRGSRMPLHSFAGGKALLARLPADRLAAYFARGPRPRFTDLTIVDEAALRRDIEHTRACGYAISREEHSIGVVGVAAALDDDHSLSVAIPSPRFDAEVEQRTIAALQQASAAVGLAVAAA